MYLLSSPAMLQIQDAKIVQSNFKLSHHNYAACVLINNAMRRSLDREFLVYYIFSLRFTSDWEYLMANRANEFNLIDYRLTDTELEEFDTWLAKQSADPTEVLTALASQSYKVSLTYVEKSEAWCCSVTGKEDAKFNAKTTLTTWADEPLESLYMAAFKVLTVFKGGKWVTKNQSRRG